MSHPRFQEACFPRTETKTRKSAKIYTPLSNQGKQQRKKKTPLEVGGKWLLLAFGVKVTSSSAGHVFGAGWTSGGDKYEIECLIGKPLESWASEGHRWWCLEILNLMRAETKGKSLEKHSLMGEGVWCRKSYHSGTEWFFKDEELVAKIVRRSDANWHK